MKPLPQALPAASAPGLREEERGDGRPVPSSATTPLSSHTATPSPIRRTWSICGLPPAPALLPYPRLLQGQLGPSCTSAPGEGRTALHGLGSCRDPSNLSPFPLLGLCCPLPAGVVSLGQGSGCRPCFPVGPAPGSGPGTEQIHPKCLLTQGQELRKIKGKWKCEDNGKQQALG